LVEEIRSLGRKLKGPIVDSSVLPNTAALLRARAKLVAGLPFKQYWSDADAPGQSGWWSGKIIAKKPGYGQLCAVKYSNGQEMFIQKAEEATFRGNLVVTGYDSWQSALDKVAPAFDYIESRLTNNCQVPYYMKTEHHLMRLAQAFDPTFVTGSEVTEDFLAELASFRPFKVHQLVPQMIKELEAYKRVAASFHCDHNDATAFTKHVLEFWAKHCSKLPAWAEAARIIFALSPNSAACERVFSLLKLFFGEQRDASLADQIEAALMLAYNKRNVG
jgi:hypothetical protein